MPRFDFKCEKCGVVEEHTLPLDHQPTDWPTHCGQVMDKQWGNPKFVVKGKFTAANGYSDATD